MSNKSLFEKLFEDVMEHDALGIPNEDAEGASDLENMGGDAGDSAEGGEDTVTLTLDKATAQALFDMLQGALGGEEESDLGGESPEAGLEGQPSEDSEDTDDEHKGSDEEESEDSEEGELRESPEQLKPFNNKGESLTKKGNTKVGGVAGKTSAHGKAQQTSQTQGTEKYMPFNQKIDHGQSMKVKSAVSTPSGQGDSVFG